MRTEVTVTPPEGLRLLDDREDLSVMVGHGPGTKREPASFRKLGTSEGLVHLTTHRFEDAHHCELIQTICGMRPKRFDTYGPKIDIDNEHLSIKWTDLCQGCMGVLAVQIKESEDEQKEESIEEMKTVQPPIITKAPPPRTGPRADPETRALLKSLIDAALDDEDGEWVSVEHRAASVSSVYREFSRGRIEVVHRKGRLYVRRVEVSDD